MDSLNQANIILGILFDPIIIIFAFFYFRFQKPWNRYPLYIIFLFLVHFLILIINNIFSILGFEFLKNPSATMIMLSSLAIIEATIFVIVMTFSTVAGQLMTTSYSVKVMEIFKAAADHIVIAITYIFNIIYNLCLLILVPQSILTQFDIYIWISLFGGIYSILILIIYVWNIIDFLNPLLIIERLSNCISISSSMGNQMEEMHNTIQPIMDIIKISLKNYDFSTAKYGLIIIKKRVCDLSFDERNEFNDLEAVCNYIQEQLLDLSLYVAYCKSILLKNLIKLNFLIAIKRIEKASFTFQNADNYNRIIKRNINFVRSLGELSIDNSYKTEARLSSIYIRRLGNVVAKTMKAEDKAIDITTSLESIGIKSLNVMDLETTKQSIKALRLLGETYARNNLHNAGCDVLDSLKAIGLKSIDKNDLDILKIIIININSIGILSARVGDKNDTKIIIRSAISFEAIFEALYRHKFLDPGNNLNSLILRCLQTFLIICMKMDKQTKAFNRIMHSLEIMGLKLKSKDKLKANILDIIRDIKDEHPDKQELCDKLANNITNSKLKPRRTKTSSQTAAAHPRSRAAGHARRRIKMETS